jgi:hypothetical protein
VGSTSTGDPSPTRPTDFHFHNSPSNLPLTRPSLSPPFELIIPHNGQIAAWKPQSRITTSRVCPSCSAHRRRGGHSCSAIQLGHSFAAVTDKAAFVRLLQCASKFGDDLNMNATRDVVSRIDQHKTCTPLTGWSRCARSVLALNSLTSSDVPRPFPPFPRNLRISHTLPNARPPATPRPFIYAYDASSRYSIPPALHYSGSSP